MDDVLDLTPTPSTHSDYFDTYVAEREPYEPVGINVGDLGHECDRKLWYDFRRVTPPEVFDGLKLSIFETGKMWERRLTERLLRMGSAVSNEQDYVTFIGAHVRGKIDAIASGLREYPDTHHIVEFKTANDRSFKALKKAQENGFGIAKSKPQHYGQCQMYMHGTGLEHALYMCVNKNTDEIHTERIAYDSSYCLFMLERAGWIIQSDDLPPRVSDKPKSPPCLFCRHKGICHEGDWPRRHCRTCLHSTAVTSTERACWNCAKWNKPLTAAEQAVGCDSHLYLPGLVPGVQVDADEEAMTVTYEMRDGSTWVNGNAA